MVAYAPSVASRLSPRHEIAWRPAPEIQTEHLPAKFVEQTPDTVIHHGTAALGERARFRDGSRTSSFRRVPDGGAPPRRKRGHDEFHRAHDLRLPRLDFE